LAGVRCSLGVEKRGRAWAEGWEVKKGRELEAARETAGMGRMAEQNRGFDEDNMRECSMGLAKE
jgi:hypothetical protein